jgi:hypothetical protein
MSEPTASHEAGHAVVALVLGLRFESVTIVTNENGNPGSILFPRCPYPFDPSAPSPEYTGYYEARIVDLLASKYAQKGKPRRYDFNSDDVQVRKFWRRAFPLSLYMYSADPCWRRDKLRELKRRARALVNAHRRDIGMVARALVQHRTLDAAAVREVLMSQAFRS